MEKTNRAWSTEARLKFIEFRLYWEGRINRADLQSHFGISTPQASLDLKAYAELATGNFEYDKQRKAYFATACFKPVLITPNAKDYLSQLELQRAEDESPFSHSSFIGESPSYYVAQMPQRVVDAGTLRLILQAIRKRKAIEIKYQSMTRLEPTWRWLAPHALASDGFRWHLRAYCFERERFSDFVFGRILEVGEERDSVIDSTNDLEWNSWLEITIGPNPALPETQKKGIELDYGMHDGTASLVIREALQYYVKKQLGLNKAKLEAAGQPQDQHIFLIRERRVSSDK